MWAIIIRKIENLPSVDCALALRSRSLKVLVVVVVFVLVLGVTLCNTEKIASGK